MPKYYCDYCDTFLTHDSPSVRKTHNAGRKHKDNVRTYYQEWLEKQTQNIVDRSQMPKTQIPSGFAGFNPMAAAAIRPMMGMMRPMVPMMQMRPGMMMMQPQGMRMGMIRPGFTGQPY